jgi:hypothetical protein
VHQRDGQLLSSFSQRASNGPLGYELRMTVSVRPGSDSGKVLVRASGQYNLLPITYPLPYQDFFAALERSLFLQAQSVE